MKYFTLLLHPIRSYTWCFEMADFDEHLHEFPHRVTFERGGYTVVSFVDGFNRVIDLRVIIPEQDPMPCNFERAIWGLNFDYLPPPPLPNRILIVNGESHRQERWYFSRLDWPGFVEALTAIFGPPSN